jgi:hypothetical protein
MFAATGLAVPLPSIVYRAAAGIAEQTQAVTVRVPGLGAIVSETTQVARRGTIKLAPEEAAAAAPAPKRIGERARNADANRRQRAGKRRDRTAGPNKATLRARPRQAMPLRKNRSATRPAADTPASSIVPDGREAPRPSSPGQSEPPEEHAPKRPQAPTEVSAPDPPVGVPEPKVDPPKGVPHPNPPPSPPPPPPSLPPLPVTPPPAGSPPAPVPVTPKAQLEGIAADLRDLIAASPGTRRADRVQQVVDKVESAIDELDETPPDNQGAVGDIKNATQKLDAALAEGVISLVERTLFVTRLNAVSTLLKAAP